MELILRHWSSIGRTLREMPTRFHPLLYYPPEEAMGPDTPHEASDWCQGYLNLDKICRIPESNLPISCKFCNLFIG
jgi:hypothetical protein